MSKSEAECEKFFDSSITLKYTDKSFELMHIFDVMKYEPRDGLYIQFDTKMKPYLLELVKGGYTAVNIKQIFKLISNYAVRLIEFCWLYRTFYFMNPLSKHLHYFPSLETQKISDFFLLNFKEKFLFFGASIKLFDCCGRHFNCSQWNTWSCQDNYRVK